MNEPNDWWDSLLASYEGTGANDASQGVFRLPHEFSDDPQDEDENAAYIRGFSKRRKELGDAFEWA